MSDHMVTLYVEHSNKDKWKLICDKMKKCGCNYASHGGDRSICYFNTKEDAERFISSLSVDSRFKSEAIYNGNAV